MARSTFTFRGGKLPARPAPSSPAAPSGAQVAAAARDALAEWGV